MHHAVTRYTEPCQIRDFVDSVNGQFVIYMMAVLWDCIGKIRTAAFAFSLVSVIGIFPVHIELEVSFPTLTLGIGRQFNFLRIID